MSGMHFYIGIDVGTGSARAGIFDGTGRLHAEASHEIEIWRPEPDFVEQSSEDIWRACCKSVRAAIADAAIEPGSVRGIGFDATCSLVSLDVDDRPVTVSPTGKDEQNVIVWMDHRAIGQAERINATGHDVLKYVGGKISPEMETPKLLWLKENMPGTWSRVARFFDLPDFLTYRATGKDIRSLCSTVCKWTYLGHENAADTGSVGKWDDSYFKQIGLGDLVDEQYKRIGQTVRPMGEPVGKGLTAQAAKELGLNEGTPIGVSIIDAHAGGIGMLGACLGGRSPSHEDMERRLTLIGGTSSCHMAVSRGPKFVPGIWGPYFSAMIPGMWLTEGGQSATGALIDHVIFSHTRAIEVREEAEKSGTTVYELLNGRIARLAEDEEFPARLTRDLHVLPYFHGNRSPRANPNLRGIVSGLRLSDTIDDLALIYYATLQAVAHGTRHIISTMNERGYAIDTIFACGGGTKNPVFIREHADITGCRIILPRELEAVLLGSAILGAVASKDFGSVMDAMAAMNGTGEIINPASGETAKYHEAKHEVFLKMHNDLLGYRQVMGTGAD
ncbi:MAG: FGGY-family carbohydrate kinase [Planctomycetota bacterium]|jgi:FGGY-family pentulose kinase